MVKSLQKFNFNMEELRIFDAFMGIGALHTSLKDLGVPCKVVNCSEIDIDAIISYAVGHIDRFEELDFSYPTDEKMKKWLMDRNIGYSYEKQKSSIPRLKKDKLKLVYKSSNLLNNLGDISMINPHNMDDFDIMNFSFSCTDLSGAGKQKGMKNEDGTPTRSGLYIYGMDILKIKKPKYIMIENVKGLIQKKFIDDFYSIIDELEELGYNCYYPKKESIQPTCLNAKDFGVPQNRERIFVICIRKDIDNGTFKFPGGFDSGIRLRDILEDTVEEKYYLNEEIQKRFKLNGKTDEDRNELNQVGTTGENKTIGQRDRTYGINGISPNLTSTDFKQPKQILDTNKPNLIGGIGEINFGKQFRQGNRVYDENSVGMCLMSQPVGNTGGYSYLYGDSNKLIQQGFLELDGYNDFSKRVYSPEGIGRTLMATGGNLNDKAGQYQMNDFRIRRLTPKECWRLMGFSDEHFDKAKFMGVSDSSLYKQAGNSIVVNVLYYIFKNLFKEHII